MTIKATCFYSLHAYIQNQIWLFFKGMEYLNQQIILYAHQLPAPFINMVSSMSIEQQVCNKSSKDTSTEFFHFFGKLGTETSLA